MCFTGFQSKIPFSVLFVFSAYLLNLSVLFAIDDDGTGVSDVFEENYGTPLIAIEDADKDGFSNIAEYYLGGNPLLANDLNEFVSHAFTSSDLTLSWPSQVGLRYQVLLSENLVDWVPFGDVLNGDGNTIQEIVTPGFYFGAGKLVSWQIQALSPLDADLDDLDAWEEFQLGTDPDDADSDDDTLNDGEEFLLNTDPNLADSDGDGFSDDAEVAMGSDPNDEDALPQLFYASSAAVYAVSSFSASSQAAYATTAFVPNEVSPNVTPGFHRAGAELQVVAPSAGTFSSASAIHVTAPQTGTFVSTPALIVEVEEAP